MLEITKTRTEMKNAFDGLISRLNMAEERISELEDMTIETSKTENQREKNQHHRTSKACAAAKSLQSCPTLCNPIDGSPQTEAQQATIPGILQARTLEWVAISLSNAWKRKVKVKLLSRVWLIATPWTAAYQVPQSMGFSRQEHWSGVPLCNTYMIWLSKEEKGVGGKKQYIKE